MCIMNNWDKKENRHVVFSQMCFLDYLEKLGNLDLLCTALGYGLYAMNQANVTCKMELSSFMRICVM